VKSLEFHNRQRTRPINRKHLAALTREILEQQLRIENFQLNFVFVEPTEMARLNQQFLNHTGSTDVITFDYSEGDKTILCGEIVICIQDAIDQAPQFNTTWQTELARYIIHGILHLAGYDDTAPAARRRMKAKEDRIVTELGG
jgi:rRNA maturation RNase YbeY